MKYIDEYRDREMILKLAAQIRDVAAGTYCFMEVCGGHTAAIHRFGIPDLLPASIKLVSGPGCPVCVTDRSYIDRIIALTGYNDITVATFGDLIRIPGSSSSLAAEKMRGAAVTVVLSASEALEIARQNPQRRIVFPAIGFETTAPGTAVTILEADKEGIENFYVMTAHKIMPPAMETIIRDGTKLDGFICPGHVAAITGASAFGFIPEKYNLACVVSGFEPLDLMLTILMLVKQVNSKAPRLETEYRRAVSEEGNIIARKYMDEVFEITDASWRGFGIIPGSGLRLRKAYSKHDAESLVPEQYLPAEEDDRCICGAILRGWKSPQQCALFAKICSPENPVGACMVSREGACNTVFKYGQHG